MATERIAVVAVNPVNGMGLFQYLEAFYENKIPCTLFAVADTNRIRTNSGIELNAHEPIASLAGHEEEYAALVFACGDAVPVFSQHAHEPWNRELLRVIRRFSELDKPLIGHCGAGLFFDMAGAAAGKRVAVHPMVQAAIREGIASDKPYEIDGRLYTAQCEHTLPQLIPHVVEVLK